MTLITGILRIAASQLSQATRSSTSMDSNPSSESFWMQTILVTGGAGFIGGCFVRQLIAEQSTRVINLDKLTYAGNLDSLAAVIDNPRHLFIQGDIGDYAFVRR